MSADGPNRSNESASQPKIDPYYLNARGSDLSFEFAQSLAKLLYDASVKRRFLASLRKGWLQGRYHCELSWHSEFFERRGGRTEMAAKLLVSPTAVGNWLNGKFGIEGEHVELIKRYYRQQLAGHEKPTSHELDLAGYRRAISLLARTKPKAPLIEQLAAPDFWRLWFLLRNTLWRKALSQSADALYEEAAAEINRQVRQVLVVSHGQLPNAYVDYTVGQLRKLFETWGAPFIIVVEYLDTVCWTGPHD